MQRVLVVLVLFFSCLSLRAADVSQIWETWVARSYVQQVVEGDQQLFVLADGALHSVNKSDRSVRLYDRTSGLSDVGITRIAWVAELKMLLIVYRSGMIDLLSSSGIESIAAIKHADHLPSKSMHDLLIVGHRAWLCSTYGIIQLNLEVASVEAMYLMGQPVESVALEGESVLWAVTEGGVLSGSLKANLQDPSAWTQIEPLGRGWKQLIATGNALYGICGGELLRIRPEIRTVVSGLRDVKRLYRSGDVLVAHSSGGLYSISGTEAQLLAEAQPEWLTGSLQRGALWLAQGSEGIVELRREGEAWRASTLSVPMDCPRDNNMYAMRYERGRLYIVSGGRDKDRFHNSGVVQIFDGRRWTALTNEDISPQSGINFRDPVDIIPHRDKKPQHYYVATWGEGLYEFDDGKLVARYDEENSALASALPGIKQFTRVGSLAYDAQGNLWMAQGLTKDSKGGSVVRLTPKGEWQAYDYGAIKASNSFHTHIALANGTKWLLDHHLSDHGEGVFVYNDRGTDDLADDAYAHYSSFREPNGKEINFSKLTAMVLDRSGALWFGSNIGFFYVQRPNVLPRPDRQPTAVRPVATNSEGSLYYVLDNVAITSIAVDRLNRKWVGTLNSGLYLLAEDGLKVLRHYTMVNSPLLDNYILSLAIDSVSGKLYIGTGMGLNVLDTASSEAGLGTKLHLIAYPNPLRPEYPDVITVEGVPAGATLHMSDAAGRLVHIGEAVDHRYQWSTYATDGRRLPSGVYTVVVYSQGGQRLGQLKVSIISND